jgi:hypothetical protein
VLESEIVWRLLLLSNFFLAFTHVNKKVGILQRWNISARFVSKTML